MLEVPSHAAVRVEMRGDPPTREGVRVSERELQRCVESRDGRCRPDHSDEGRAAYNSGPWDVRESHGFGIEQGLKGTHS